MRAQARISAAVLGGCRGVGRAGRGPGGIAGALQSTAARCCGCARHQGRVGRFLLGCFSQTR